MSRRAPQLQPRLRFPDGGPDAFGPGKADLLRHIAAAGSIRTAARELGMSYDRAWKLVQAMNRLFRPPLVTMTRGGGSGGGAQLTTAGADVLRRYTRMEAACHAATRADWRVLQRRLRG
jgi:molybdate transport system regulatory protein